MPFYSLGTSFVFSECREFTHSQTFFRTMNTKMIISIAMLCGALFLLTLSLSAAGRRRTPLDNSTVTSLDRDRYLGEWYEIVRKPHTFEKGMSHVKTTYTLLPDGKIEVVNEGIKNGKRKVTRGKARTTANPGQLKVTFFIFPAEYNILKVAPDYSYSVVGGSNDKYLWILSRTPQMHPDTLNTLLSEVATRGYDLSDIIYVEQE